MNDIIRLIQRQVSIDDHVIFTLNTGKEVSGILAEISRSHVAIEQEGKYTTLLPHVIGSWEVQKEQSEQVTATHQVEKNKNNDKIEKNTVSQTSTHYEEDSSIKHTEKNNDFLRANTHHEKSSSVENYDAEAIKKVIPIEDSVSQTNTHYEEGSSIKDTEKNNDFLRANAHHEKSSSVENYDAEAIKKVIPIEDSVSQTNTHYEEGSSIKDTEKNNDFLRANTHHEKSSSVENYDAEAFKKVYAIEARFKAQIEAARIDNIIAPNFEFPDDINWQQQVKTRVALSHRNKNKYDVVHNTQYAKTVWLSAKGKYDTAYERNELSVKYGRTRLILNDFKNMHDSFPWSASVERHLAYLYWLMGDKDNALQHYKNVAPLSLDQDDWFNVAVLALQTQEELACYALEIFFQKASMVETMNAWYIYVRLIRQFRNHIAVRKLLETSDRKLTENEETIFFETGIYLLQEENKEENKEQLAINFVQKQKLRSLHTLTVDIFRQFTNQPNDSFKKIKSEMLSTELDKKVAPKPPSAKTFTSSKSPQDVQFRPKQVYNNPALPSGSNPFAQAVRARNLEKDLSKAVNLYRLAIKQNDHFESAVKNLASVLEQLGRVEEAIEVLQQYRGEIANQKSVDNMLVILYQKAKQYDKALVLFEKFKKTADTTKKFQYLWKIAYCETKQENYSRAEQSWKEILRREGGNVSVKRNLAICFYKQDRIDEAENILNQIQKASSDSRTVKLYELIQRAKKAGKSDQRDDSIIQTMLDDITIQNTLSEFSSEISQFTKFFLDNCSFRNIPPERIQENEFGQKIYKGTQRDVRYDLEKLESFAKEARTRRPIERSDNYLAAAKIIEEDGEKSSQFYQYLCRSFASRGDAAVAQNKHLDVACELYCEALAVYDGYSKKESKGDEQDANNAIIRFLFATLGQSYIPLDPNRMPNIDDSIETVFQNHPQPEKVFDAIAYVILNSRFAANRILNRLFRKSDLQNLAIKYLKDKGVPISHYQDLDNFVTLWNHLRQKKTDEIGRIKSELRLLHNVQLTTAFLEDAIERAKGVIHRFFFDLEQQRVRQLQQILENALVLCKQTRFEEKERLCSQIDRHCQDLLQGTEENPMRLSVEEIYPVIQTIQRTIKEWLEELYQSSVPQITLRLAEDMESYTPDENQQIDVQVVVSNRMECSPAESLELIIEEDEALFTLKQTDIKLKGSLRGGDQQTLRILLWVSKQAINSETFSLPVYIKYNTRSKEMMDTPVENFSIRLYQYQEFEEIENPYAAYAEGGIVDEKEMFYGRGEFIANVANTLQKSSSNQSKWVLIYGQKRSGKSSILTHLKNKLQERNDNLVLDVGNIGSLLDEHSSIPLLYQILWSILKELRYAVEDQEDYGLPPLNLVFPEEKDFYEHPSPLMCFNNTFDAYKRKSTKLDEWLILRTVLLIDEFSYIYRWIVSGRISDSFMEKWKALLQDNCFSAVLVGQDVMPKFKSQFSNEFGTAQDERVSYLREEDARRLIDEPIRIGGREGESRYREKAIDLIFKLTAGSPFYIQIICNRLVEYMNRKRARLVTDSDVKQVKNELIRGVNGLSKDKFDNLINSGDTSKDAIKDEDALKVLTKIAKNGQTGPCSRNSIVCETENPIDYILDDLVKRDVVESQSMQYYKIRVDLFKEWLIANR